MNWWAVALLILLVLAIGLTPRIPIGTVDGLGRIIDIRGEDILMLVLIPVWFFAFLRSRKKDIPLLAPILFWLGIGLVSLLVNWLFLDGNIARGIFYYAKELQFFFVYFFTFLFISGLAVSNLLMRVWLGVGLANISWVFYQLFFTERGFGEYGTAALNEWGVFPTGSFFLILFVFLFNWWLYSYWKQGEISEQKQYLYLIAILSIIIGILGALSKTAIYGFWFALAISLALYVWNTRTLKTAVASSLLFAGVGAFTFGAYFSLILPNFPGADRIISINSASQLYHEIKRVRLDDEIIPQMQEAFLQANQHPILYAIGHGKGAILTSPESHNQYLRNFVETGIAGSMIFIALIISILLAAWKRFNSSENTLAAGLSSGIIAATLTMLFISLAADAFIVVKLNMTYWFFMGLAMAMLYKNINGNTETKRN
ncbi:hypothetical protein A3A20_02425 [Candidatus Wolfebacteria bacterium RIFCSPLOWO2_01_FULL_45_19]|uniref:O-antigen polymerase n=1 Tax=Candidatus Wolfebacteria bacterium RIFCSPLOWO2_01_FULL_45_19 TaxID=1802557 RepID=A0A1F8DRA9_9BACT|nr:MAG: O-antigen polymerase [Parcubacteria group bacterium GW2011_GWB1_45_9]OGM91160.1 MAG: hypothetical protein A3A20_02425 [Candidatus Wolfebacteria bacterium RIFCSPLOWO2_01_FULL_45_19]